MQIVRKLILSVVAQAALLSALGLYVAHDAWQRVAASRTLVEKIRRVDQLSKLLHEIQRERGYTVLLLAGESERLEQQLYKQRALTDFIQKALFVYPLQQAAGVDLARIEAQRSRVDARALGADAAIREYSQLTNALLAELGRLTRPDRVTGELSAPLSAHMTLARIKEYAGLERALVGYAFATAAVPRPELAQHWTDIAARQSELLERGFLTTAAPALLRAYEKALSADSATELEHLRHVARLRFAGGETIDPQRWFARASERIDALAKVEVASLELLQAESSRIADAEARKIALVLALLLLAALGGVHYGRNTLHTVARPIRSLHRAITALADDPSSPLRADPAGRGELSELAAAFNRLIDLRQQYDAEMRLSAVVFRHALEGLLVTDPSGNIISVNPRFCEIMGYPMHQLGGKNVRVLKSGGQDAAVYREMWQRIGSQGAWQGRLWNRRKDGSDCLVRLSIAAVKDSAGSVIYYVGVYGDITEQFLTQRRLQEAEQYNRLVISSLGEGLLGVAADGCIRFVNPEAERLLRREGQELVGRDVYRMVHCKGLDGASLPLEENPIHHVMASGEGHRGEVGFTRRDGKMFPVDCIVTPMWDNGVVTGAVVVFQDISQRKQAEEEILYLAHHDSLTGMPNRRRLEQHLQFVFAQGKRFGRCVAVLIIDLDRFKQVNDTLGHPVGDALLVEVSKRIKGLTRESDLLARLAGDEFVLVASSGDAPPASEGYWADHKVFEAMAVAQKVLDAFQHPVTACGHDLYVSPSIGISLYPYHSEDTAEILKQADQAMYRAKELGGNTYAVYSGEFGDDCATLNLETRLRRALDNEEFVLFYQPIVDLQTNRLVGVEALIRWQDADALVAPGDFIPFAEQTGLIIPIGDWVIREACRQIGEWRRAGHDIYVAVNLSARHLLRRDLARWLRDLLAAGALPPSALELEVTEHTGMAGHYRAEELMKELGADGMRLALDDFGTGYSCLTRLRDFPMDVLKIDRSFTADLPETANPNTVIVKNVIALAQDFGLTVLAEGVETEAQWNYFRHAKCNLAQGFYFCRPLPADEVRRVIERSCRGEVWFATPSVQEQLQETAHDQ